jgi:hypothetical protein
MNQAYIKFLLLSFLVVILSTSCGNIEADTPALPDFSDAYSITIGDYWSGLPSPTTPLNSFYTLENSKDHFEGTSLFSVGGSYVNQNPLQEATIISIPNETIQSFLKKLATSKPERGEYNPDRQETDNYPYIFIRLIYGNAEIVEFSTSSQGDKHIPWQVKYQGQSYIINSGVPSQALAILRPHLSQDVLQKIIGQAQLQDLEQYLELNPNALDKETVERMIQQLKNDIATDK